MYHGWLPLLDSIFLLSRAALWLLQQGYQGYIFGSLGHDLEQGAGGFRSSSPALIPCLALPTWDTCSMRLFGRILSSSDQIRQIAFQTRKKKLLSGSTRGVSIPRYDVFCLPSISCFQSMITSALQQYAIPFTPELSSPSCWPAVG